MRENQVGSRLDRDYINHLFRLRQILKQAHSVDLRFVFLDLKAAFDSLNRVLWCCILLKGMPEKFVSTIESTYVNNLNGMRAYGGI